MKYLKSKQLNYKFTKLLFKYNPRKCNSASGFSGCVQRLQSKCVIALLTDAEIVRIFEKTLIGGYLWVNTRMTFF